MAPSRERPIHKGKKARASTQKSRKAQPLSGGGYGVFCGSCTAGTPPSLHFAWTVTVERHVVDNIASCALSRSPFHPNPNSGISCRQPTRLHSHPSPKQNICGSPPERGRGATEKEATQFIRMEYGLSRRALQGAYSLSSQYSVCDDDVRLKKGEESLQPAPGSNIHSLQKNKKKGTGRRPWTRNIRSRG